MNLHKDLIDFLGVYHARTLSGAASEAVPSYHYQPSTKALTELARWPSSGRGGVQRKSAAIPERRGEPLFHAVTSNIPDGD